MEGSSLPETVAREKVGGGMEEVKVRMRRLEQRCTSLGAAGYLSRDAVAPVEGMCSEGRDVRNARARMQ